MPGMYSMLGGRPAFDAAVEDFYRRIIADPRLRPYFEHIDLARLKGHQHSFLAMALGGPRAYIGRTMSTAHATLVVTDEAFDRVLEHLVHTLADAGVPARGVRDVVTGLLGLRHDIVRAPGLERDRGQAPAAPPEAPAAAPAAPAAPPDAELDHDPEPGSVFEPHPDNPASSQVSRRARAWR